MGWLGRCTIAVAMLCQVFAETVVDRLLEFKITVLNKSKFEIMSKQRSLFDCWRNVVINSPCNATTKQTTCQYVSRTLLSCNQK